MCSISSMQACMQAACKHAQTHPPDCPWLQLLDLFRAHCIHSEAMPAHSFVMCVHFVNFCTCGKWSSSCRNGWLGFLGEQLYNFYCVHRSLWGAVSTAGIQLTISAHQLIYYYIILTTRTIMSISPESAPESGSWGVSAKALPREVRRPGNHHLCSVCSTHAHILGSSELQMCM
jgi:hypothetical protein